ncbi:MAG: hypothetical protein QKV96_gp46 [Methanophagales virus GBV303]|uniref:Uncharacterized protein n=1 Tax=Methanophagales virus GBV303 TaxID=2986514 RepID=A0A9E8VFL4_9VIRU|nr:MAG: hypothetical protein QKV96_gp46 [Methanophagales virus GBV303]WAE39682.1 MAG: hypothetical protein NNKAGPMP_00046 [Methanophagales virus GBV303]
MAEEEKRKVVVSVALSVDEYLRLEEAVVRKHGRKWGVFSEFVREAIKKAVEEVLQARSEK